jgi:hypothetical protein
VEAFRDAEVEIQTLPERSEPVRVPEIATPFSAPATTNVHSNAEPAAADIFPEILDATGLLPAKLSVEAASEPPPSVDTGQTLPEIPSSLNNLYDSEIAGPLQSNVPESELTEDTATRKKTA